MQLKDIDKQRYSKHFKQLFIGVSVLMLSIALVVSQLLMLLTNSTGDSNFALNVAGAASAAIVAGYLIRRYRHHPWMYELMYVWQLKQALNRIYRKQKAIKAAMQEGNRDAMVIMNFSYQGSKQLYHLDNNTITMDELNKAITELSNLLEQHQFSIEITDYRPELLDQF